MSSSITLLLSSSSHLHVVVLMKEDRALVHVFFCCFGEENFSVMGWKHLRLCSKPFFVKTNFWANIAYPMLYLVELAFFRYQDRVIRSSIAQDMNDTVGEVKTANNRTSEHSTISIKSYTEFLDMKML